MARHRAVRGMNLDDEYDDDDDYYGHSVEDNFCISPGTAAQFTFNRSQHTFGSYMGDEEVPEESDEDAEHGGDVSPRVMRSKLNDMNQAKLSSCLEEIHNILGETRPDSVYTEAVIRHNFDLQAALDELLSQKEAPKPQRAPRQNRRNRSQGDSDDDSDSDQDSDSQTECGVVGSNDREGGGESKPEQSLGSSASKILSDISNVSISSNSGSDIRELSLADLAKRHQGQSEVKVSQDWIKNNVCQYSDIPKVSGLTQALGHMKVDDTKSTKCVYEETSEGEGFGLSTSDCVTGRSSSQKDINAEGLGRSPKSSLGSSAGSDTGLSLAQLASLHQQQSTAALTVSPLTSKMQTISPPFQATSSSPSLAQLAYKHQQSTVSKDASSSSLADLAKQHSTSKTTGTLSLSALAKQNSSSAGITSNQLSGLSMQKSGLSTVSAVSCGSSAGLSLAQLASCHKAGPLALGLLAQGSSVKKESPAGVSLASLANAHTKTSHMAPVTSNSSSVSKQHSSDVSLSLSYLLRNKEFRNKEVFPEMQLPSEEQTPSPEVQSSDFEMQCNDIPLILAPQFDPALVAMPSVLGKALCLLKTRKRKSTSEFHQIKYRRFAYNDQRRDCKQESPLHKREIGIFDFSTPSPDDLVKLKQKGAFTRTGERHLSS